MKKNTLQKKPKRLACLMEQAAKMYMAEIGRLGGLAATEAKTQASRLNGSKGGRPRKVVVPPPRLSRLQLERQRKVAKQAIRRSRAMARKPSLRFEADVVFGLVPPDVVKQIRQVQSQTRPRNRP